MQSTSPKARKTWEKVIGKLRSGAMPPPGRPRPDPDGRGERARVAGNGAGRRRGHRSRTGPDRQHPSAQSRRIPERDSRSAGAGRRCHVAAAGRQRGRTRLRQHSQHAVGFADPAGPVSVGGAETEPAGGRASAGRARHRGIQGPAGSGRVSGRGPAVRVAGRRRHPPSVSGRWRIRHPGPAVPPALRRGHRTRFAARGGDPGGWRADSLFGCRWRRDRWGSAGRIRRRHFRESGVGAVRPERRRRPRSALPGQGRLASRDRFVPRASDRGRGWRSPPAGVPGARRVAREQPVGSHRLHPRPVRGVGPGRYPEPTQDLHLSANGPARRGTLRGADSHVARR